MAAWHLHYAALLLDEPSSRLLPPLLGSIFAGPKGDAPSGYREVTWLSPQQALPRGRERMRRELGDESLIGRAEDRSGRSPLRGGSDVPEEL